VDGALHVEPQVAVESKRFKQFMTLEFQALIETIRVQLTARCKRELLLATSVVGPKMSKIAQNRPKLPKIDANKRALCCK
jgi:hypothetical protein